MAVVADIDLSRAFAAAMKRPRVTGPALKARQESLSLIVSESLVAPKCSFRNIASRELLGTPAELLLGDGALQTPGVEAVGGLTGVTAVACTLGPALEQRVSTLCAERKLSLALALDELGNELLIYTVRLAAGKVRGEARRLGLSTGDMLTPGGRGLSLDQQAKVVELAGGEQIGITVTQKGMLLPVKSRSILVSVGKGLTAKPWRRRCDTCSSREQCRYRTR
jgi:hypothetical protein